MRKEKSTAPKYVGLVVFGGEVTVVNDSPDEKSDDHMIMALLLGALGAGAVKKGEGGWDKEMKQEHECYHCSPIAHRQHTAKEEDK
ncbi:hypothetical protein HY250_00155 [Candidatus Azambacteria bacterium]|nr:hypothetical protein [Candidatus Azambacteria bacterium]MBI3684811.1 hypothetical protein [Candidatus Azambacteria bacterium]